MKTIGTILLALVLIAFVLVFAGCAVEETTTTTTDAKSGLVTVEKRISKKTDAAAWALAGRVVDGYAPRGRVVREEKSGWVSNEEIQKWYRP